MDKGHQRKMGDEKVNLGTRAWITYTFHIKGLHIVDAKSPEIMKKKISNTDGAI